MLDCFTKNGYKIETDGVAINVIEPNGNVAGAFHPLQGDVVMGVRSPAKTLEILEALKDGRRLLSRDSHPIQCEQDV